MNPQSQMFKKHAFGFRFVLIDSNPLYRHASSSIYRNTLLLCVGVMLCHPNGLIPAPSSVPYRATGVCSISFLVVL